MKSRAWIGFLARRWFGARRQGGGGAASLLAAAGIGIGVATLVLVLGVMNGFQQGYIDTILEVSSYHLRLEPEPGSTDALRLEALARELRRLPGARSVSVFATGHAILSSRDGRSQAVELRALPQGGAREDPGLLSALGLSRPEELEPGSGIIIGAELGRWLGLEPGERASLLAVGSSEAEGVFTKTRELRVAGSFRSEYFAFDSGLAFVSLEGGEEAWKPVLGIKLQDRYALDAFRARARPLLEAAGFDPALLVDWRSYNRSFFGALRTEKLAMLLLVSLIFAVVGVNIFHAMRRAVAERMEEIAVLRALGASPGDIRLAFVLDGFVVGSAGCLAGLLLGLALAVNVNEVFALAESLVNGSLSLLSAALGLLGLGSGGGEEFRVFSRQYFYLTEVPVRLLYPEILFISVAAIGSAALAAGGAALASSRMNPAEVLRYE